MSPKWIWRRGRSPGWSKCRTSCAVWRAFDSCILANRMSSATNSSNRLFGPMRPTSLEPTVVAKAMEGECRPMERERKGRTRPEHGLRPLLAKLGLVTIAKSGAVKVAWRAIGITALLVAVLTVLLLPRLQLRARTLALGDIAPVDIKAHSDFLIEDEVSAQKKRREAEDRVLPVYDFDLQAAAAIDHRLKRAMQAIEAAYRVRPPELSGTLRDARSTTVTPEDAARMKGL